MWILLTDFHVMQDFENGRKNLLSNNQSLFHFQNIPNQTVEKTNAIYVTATVMQQCSCHPMKISDHISVYQYSLIILTTSLTCSFVNTGLIGRETIVR